MQLPAGDDEPARVEFILEARVTALVCPSPLRLMGLRRSPPLPAPPVQDDLHILNL